MDSAHLLNTVLREKSEKDKYLRFLAIELDHSVLYSTLRGGLDHKSKT